MRTLKFLLIWGGWAFVAVTAVAQEDSIDQEETINQDVRVVREYNPTVSDAFKINEMPEQSDADVPAPDFSYELSGKAMVGTPEVVPLIPAKMAKEPREELYPSYLQGYVGNYNMLGGALRYNLVHNEKFALALKAGHESSMGDIEVMGTEADADYHETLGGLYMRHFFKRKTLSIDMDFSNLAYRYYGFHTMDATRPYLAPYPSLEMSSIPPQTQGSNLMHDDQQHQTAFDVTMGLKNQVTGHMETRYDLKMGYSTFGNGTGVKENQFRYTGDFDFSLGELGLRLGTAMDHASTNVPVDEMPWLYQFENRQQTLVQMNPALVKTNKNLDLHMGLRFAAEFDDLEDNLYISPDVRANLTVAEGFVAIEGGITGEIKPSTYRSIMEENLYVSPDLNVKTAFHGVRFFLGAKGNFTRSTSFAARMDYNVFHNEHFFVNRQFVPYGGMSGEPNDFSNQFGVDYDDGRMLSVSGEFKMGFSPQLDVLLRGAYYGWDTDSLEHAWHKPKSEVGARMTYKYNESLTLYVSGNMMGPRYASLPEGIEKLDPVYDFNIGANYNHNKRWHFFGEVRNLAASKYYRWYGYPMQGINGRVGLGYSF
ncbi:TonB-dependent receptor [Geofilum rubicundum]|uniref:Putative TonB-dependent receptor n=1 Tax=Geofilum rubicundum JCM 15548 TaxID=1236989 RepID=A0A0E9LRY8_9BACT|nr:TonB-dependent receptor [Geofilum rubicundum]GAO27896.1 putative TonB-dependent receptor [Geofilum rubicundum JCM 15548]